MIHFFKPFDPNKNIGRAYNMACSTVPNSEDYICVMDGDVMFLLPDWGKHIQAVLDHHGDSFDVYGCLTNRLAGAHQQYQGKLSGDPDIRNHISIAQKCYAESYLEVKETTANVAAMLMIFKKSLWEKIKFQENTIACDRYFTTEVMAQGGRLGIMQGLYVFHLYRFNSKYPMYDTEHLR